MQTVKQLWQPIHETAEILKDNIQKYKTIVLPQYKCVLVKLYLKYIDKIYDIAVWFYCVFTCLLNKYKNIMISRY